MHSTAGFIAIFVSIMLVGCQAEHPAVTNAPTTQSGAAGDPPATRGTGTSAENEAGSKAPDQGSLTSQDNPSRLFQLRELGKSSIKVGGKAVPIWIMNSESKRQEGMMFLTAKDVKTSEGMLFVFPEEQAAGRGFWMHNTILPLDIVYISSAGKVVHMVKGKPHDDTSLPCPKPFRFVLEMRQGAVGSLPIKVGSTVDIPGPVQKDAS